MDILILIIIIVGAVILFASEIFPIDMVAGLILGALLLTNLISVDEALTGVSNPATATIAAMFVLSFGLSKTGAINYLGDRIIHYTKGNVGRIFVIFLLVASIISGFINNTAAVAIFLPMALQFAHEFRFSPSKILIPLSYASIFGGTMTLIGTSTNIIVSSIAADHGLGALGMFEFTKLGIVFVVVGLLYLFLFARKNLPVRSILSSLTQKYHMTRYLTELQVPEDSPLVGKTPLDKQISNRYDLNILGIVRGKRKILIDIRITKLRPDDILLVRGPIDRIMRLKEREKLLLLTDTKLNDEELAIGDNTLTEVLVSPNSRLIGSTLKEIDFRRRYGCFVLAIRKQGETLRNKISNTPMSASDTLLIYGSKRRIDALKDDQNFVVLEEVDIKLQRGHKWIFAITIILAVVLLAALNVMPILKSAILGVLALVLTRTITMQEAYKAVDWSVIFLLAGVIPLGRAMENTGLAQIIGDSVAQLGGPYGPVVVLGALYVATNVLTETMSNNSTAIIMAPIAITTANALSVSPLPFLMAVTFAASASFMTPVGYQTNTMVYGPGGYKYTDYLKFGFPLSIMFLFIATLLIPMIWPF
ncbi:MAG: SLC13 family permease [Candidatus Marinimicrobia bacterium]|nr:SLC13 family permease [Candidatus Neomarinimicrobiota bacterium]MCF7828859.1 SLC13 family permease [Candidatus Neomarinimicrobiota bacterium]MCF7880776.1 SLC13 family permease [Candidatus Neomarinimicrobiota bacterium]